MAWTLDQIMANPVANTAFGTWMHENDEGPAYDFLSLVPRYRATPTRVLADQLLDLLPRSADRANNDDRVNVADSDTQALRDRIDLDPDVRARVAARNGNPPSALSPNDFDLLYAYVKAAVDRDPYNSQLARFFQTAQGTQYGGDNSPYKDALNRILDNHEAAGALYKDTMDREAREGRPATELTRNIDFLLAVRAYKATLAETRARAIYDAYVAANGELSLSLLPNVTRAAIAQRMPPVRWTARFRTGPADLFNTAESTISGAIAYLVPDFRQRVGDAQFAQWVGDPPPGGADDIDGGLDHMGGGLADGEIAEGGDNGINPPPPAPEAPDIDPPEPPADPNAHDDPGHDHDHDESKSDGRGEAVRAP